MDNKITETGFRKKYNYRKNEKSCGNCKYSWLAPESKYGMCDYYCTHPLLQQKMLVSSIWVCDKFEDGFVPSEPKEEK